MPKILDYFKEKEISHEDAIAFFEKNYKPESEEEEEEEEEQEEGENDKPDDESGKPNDDEDKEKKIDIDISKLTSDITDAVSKSVSKTVTAEIKKQIKLLRGKPPKGEIGDISLGNDPFIKKNLYERIV